MANALMEHVEQFEVNGEQVKLSGNTISTFIKSGNGDITDQEAFMFLQLCKFQHLNPYLNEAYLVKFGSSPAQIIVSKEAFMKRANANEHFKGMTAGIVVQRGEDMLELEGALKLPKDILIGGWAEVVRDDRTQPIKIILSMDEFGKGQSTWKSMPQNMIRKTAIVNALREAFPETLGSMYTEDDKNPNDTAKVVETAETKAPSGIEARMNAEVKPKPIETKEPEVIDAEVVEEQASGDLFTESGVDKFTGKANDNAE